MLAIARATLLGPRYVLMDESTEGLAPSIVENVARLVEHLPTLGIGILVTDQDRGVLVSSASRWYEMDRGVIVGGGIPAAVGSSATESKEMT
jgi:branched-chain amino acid transport system ATP-binding protein